MGKYVIGLFFVLICLFLAYTVYTKNMQSEMRFSKNVDSDILELHQDPYDVRASTNFGTTWSATPSALPAATP